MGLKIMILTFFVILFIFLLCVLSEEPWKRHLHVLNQNNHSIKYSQASSTLAGILERTVELQELGSKEKVKLRLANKTFWERVGSLQGGLSFLLSLGFHLERDGEHDFALVVDPRLVNSSLYREILEILKERDQVPSSFRATEAAKNHSHDNHAGTEQGTPLSQRKSRQKKSSFDPFKSSFLSTNPDTGALKAKTQSNLRQKLDELRAKKEEMESGTIERNIMIFSPDAQYSTEKGTNEETSNQTETVPNVLFADMKSKQKKKPIFQTRF